jgi:large subunit ribosomal protein L3
MTQLFEADGTVVPGTVIKAGPCVVVQAKSVESDGYEALQIGLVDPTPAKANKPTAGHYKKAGVPPTRVRREIKVAPGGEPAKPGDQVLVDMFAAGERVDIIGASRGRGFQGVVRRHNFRGGAASHGSMFHRAPGSIGASAYPSRVYPGRGMPGQTGNKRVTVKNARVVKVDVDRNLLFIKGGVPGARNSYVRILKAV